MSQKRCQRCQQFLDFSNFSKLKNSKDGYNIRCKSCDISWRKERRLSSVVLRRNSKNYLENLKQELQTLIEEEKQGKTFNISLEGYDPTNLSKRYIRQLINLCKMSVEEFIEHKKYIKRYRYPIKTVKERRETMSPEAIEKDKESRRKASCKYRKNNSKKIKELNQFHIEKLKNKDQTLCQGSLECTKSKTGITKYCLEHWFTNFADTSARRNNIPSKIFVNYIKTLWNNQQGKCAVTGINLIPGQVNLDHVIPISKGGTNDLSNLRLIHKQINYFKLDLPDEKFKELIKEIGPALLDWANS